VVVVIRPVRRPILHLLPYFQNSSVFVLCEVIVWGTNLMFCGGSMEGTNSRPTYAIPTNPIMVPKTLLIVHSSRRIDPTKM